MTELEGRARYERFADRLYAPFKRSLQIDFVLLAITAAFGLYVSSISNEIASALAVAVVGTAVACAVSWWWLFDPKRRAALEVLADHQVREGDDWKSATATSLPATVRAAERWLREHPDDPVGAPLQARVGCFADARASIRRTEPESPEDALHIEIFERQLQVYEGSTPATADRDPWEVLTAARGDVGEVDPRARATRCIRIIVTIHVLFALTVWFGAAFAAGL